LTAYFTEHLIAAIDYLLRKDGRIFLIFRVHRTTRSVWRRDNGYVIQIDYYGREISTCRIYEYGFDPLDDGVHIFVVLGEGAHNLLVVTGKVTDMG